MRCFVVGSFAMLLLTYTSCGDSDKAQKSPANSGQSGVQKQDADGKVADHLAKLPAADRAAVEKQRDCPVSGERLGSMGAPIKVTVKERDVWLCCSGCKSKLEADPDKYLAKLK